jgi:two-component system, sensor histidine kinase and response regulator
VISRLSLTFRMTAFIVLVCALLIGSDIWRSLNARTVQLQEMKTATSNLAQAMAQHANDSIKEADILVSDIVERVQHDGTDAPAIARLHQLLLKRVAKSPDLAQIDNIYVIGQDGRLITDGRNVTLPSYNNSDREYFIFHRAHADLGAHIGSPVISRATGKWILPLTRRINAADGSFAGVVLAAIDVDFFVRYYEKLDVGRAGAVALILENGTMVMRRPFESRFIGKDVRDTALFQAHLSGGNAGTFLTKSSQDGITRLNSFRTLDDYPIFVAAALSKDEQLDAWWTDTVWHATGIAALAAVLAMLGHRLVRQLARQSAIERELAGSLEMTRAILDTAINPIITITGTGKVRSFNAAARRFFGYEPDEIIGCNIRALVPPTYLEVYNAYTAQFAKGGLGEAGARVELAGLRKDRSVFPAQVTTGSMTVDGELCFVCVVTDITEQQNQRAELTAARDQLLLAADTAELGIWSWRLRDDTLQWNERMFDMYEQPRSLAEHGLNFEHWRERVHRDDIDMSMAALNAVVEGRGTDMPAYRVVLPDGRTRHILTRVRLERDRHGVPTVMSGVNHDVTAQHELEYSLRDAKEKADSASAAKSSFLANMSHEIRTPMNAVLGMLQLVQLTALNSRQRDYIQNAETAAKSLLGLLNDILDYSKIEAGKMQLEVHPFEFEPMMRDLGVILAGNQRRNEVEVLFDLDPTLPQCLIGDRLRLQQVLINLAGNALKFTTRGQVVVSVEVLERTQDSVRARVSVTDSGIGIEADQLGRIFDGFSQAEASTSRRFGGTGLGLAICKRLVGLMGAELKVESRIGVGSRFWFDLTLDSVDTIDRADVPLLPTGPRRSLRILVADDNPLAGEVLVRIAAGLGWHADLSSSGLDAVGRSSEAIRRGEPYDVVLMDWRMPDLDGMKAARLLQEAKHGVATPVVIMVTAYGREVLAESEDGGGAPFNGFLTKPVTPGHLSDAVWSALGDGKPAVEPEVSSAPRSGRLTGLRLLVVEDNALNRQVAHGLLSAEGAQVELAEGGLDGVRCVVTARQPFDAVLMDIQMPDIDGYEATRRIRAVPALAGLAIIAMTANASGSDRDACLRVGMNDHVDKPIDLERLVPAVLAQTVSRQAPRSAVAIAVPVVADDLVESRESIILRFGGNLALIQSVLKIFAAETERQFARLSGYMADANHEGASGIAHTIKGTAGTMGARALAARASQLERELRPGASPDGVRPAAQAYIAEFKRLLDASVERLTDMFESPSVTSGAAKREPLPGDVWRDRLQAILALLESSNLKAIAATEALSAHTWPDIQSRFERFLTQVQQLEFSVAIVSARELLEQT